METKEKKTAPRTKKETASASLVKKPAANVSKRNAKPVSSKSETPKAEKNFRDGLVDGINLSLPVYKVIEELNKDRLDNIAVETDIEKYTYRKMFRMWEDYAKVFSALNITNENNSRVAIMCPNNIELISAYFALNMLGVTVSLHEMMVDAEEFLKSVKVEKITDVIVYDTGMTPEVARDILDKKDEYGLNNIIVVKNSSLDRFNISPLENMLIDRNYVGLRFIPGLIFMDDILEKYENSPIKCADVSDDHIAAIFHTSGSTKGVRKPVPFTNRQLNSAAAFVFSDESFKKFEGRGRLLLEMDISHTYFYTDELMASFFLGCTLITSYYVQYSKDYLKFMEEHNVNIWVTVVIVMNFLIGVKRDKYPNLSAVEKVVLGGTAVSSEKKKEFNDFLKKCHCDAKAQVGYGLTEAGGACALCKSDDEPDDSTGYPLPGFDFKIYNENENRFYDISDGENMGGLYIGSEGISNGILDGEKVFENTVIEGKEYLCTNDLVRVNPNGSITCCGRMNNFFTNSDGVKFDAGLVENAVSKESGISECCVIAGYDKSIRDSIPVLYVETKEKEKRNETVKNALYSVFVKNGNIKNTNLPSQVIFVEGMPYNSSNKVDKYALVGLEVDINDRFNVEPKKDKEDNITDILLTVPGDNSCYRAGKAQEMKNLVKRNLNSMLMDEKLRFKVPPEGLSMGMSDFIQYLASMMKNQKNKDGVKEEKECGNILGLLFPWDDEEDDEWPESPFVSFFENMEKPELSEKETENILDSVQDFLGYFYEADKVKYVVSEK